MISFMAEIVSTHPYAPLIGGLVSSPEVFGSRPPGKLRRSAREEGNSDGNSPSVQDIKLGLRFYA